MERTVLSILALALSLNSLGRAPLFLRDMEVVGLILKLSTAAIAAAVTSIPSPRVRLGDDVAEARVVTRLRGVRVTVACGEVERLLLNVRTRVGESGIETVR